MCSADHAVGVRCPGWAPDQENHADQQDPAWEKQLEPLVLAGCQQQRQRNQIAEVGEAFLSVVYLMVT